MLRVKKLKKFKNNFPILVGNKAISNHLCTSLIKEISSSETFDDLIMGGRSRINKGSKNFKKYINKSKISKKLFQLFNSKKFYNKIENIFKKNFKNQSWVNLYPPKLFNTKKFTIKKRLIQSNLKLYLVKTTNTQM